MRTAGVCWGSDPRRHGQSTSWEEPVTLQLGVLAPHCQRPAVCPSDGLEPGGGLRWEPMQADWEGQQPSPAQRTSVRPGRSELCRSWLPAHPGHVGVVGLGTGLDDGGCSAVRAGSLGSGRGTVRHIMSLQMPHTHHMALLLGCTSHSRL